MSLFCGTWSTLVDFNAIFNCSLEIVSSQVGFVKNQPRAMNKKAVSQTDIIFNTKHMTDIRTSLVIRYSPIPILIQKRIP